MQRAYEAVSLSERLYDEIDAVDARSNVDIEKRLRRAEITAAHAQTWVAVAQRPRRPVRGQVAGAAAQLGSASLAR